MALDNPEVVQFEMEADVFTLKRTKGGVHFSVDGNKIMDDLPSAKIDVESGKVTIMGRPAGDIEPSCGDVEAMAASLSTWFPKGQVNHIHSTEEFDSMKGNGIVVGKFSAEWCGPCKMVAPRIEKMSLQYPDVTFIHIDGDQCKALFRREGATCYPTFMFWQEGNKTAHKVEGADADKVETIIQDLGATRQEIVVEDFEEEEMTIVCKRDQWCFKKRGKAISLEVDGKEVIPAGKVPRVEVDLATRKITIGRGGGVVFAGGDYDANAALEQLASWFPTKVKHVHTTEEFDKLLSDNAVVVAKFSAEWCGPCKAIAPAYHELSCEHENMVFVHIDVDQCKALSQREGVQAMPTFHFFVNGQKNAGKMVRGANIAKVKEQVNSLVSVAGSN